VKNTLDLAYSKSCRLRILSRIKDSSLWAIISQLWRGNLRKLIVKSTFLSSSSIAASYRWDKKTLFASILLWVIAYFRFQIELDMPLRRLLQGCSLWMRVLHIVFDLLLVSSLLHLLVIQKQGILMTVNLARTFKSCFCDILALRSLRMILRSSLVLLLLLVGNYKLAVLIVRYHYLCLAQILATKFLTLKIILRLVKLIFLSFLIISIILFSLNHIGIFHFDVFKIHHQSKTILLTVVYLQFSITV
jgi:hypothetical protein